MCGGISCSDNINIILNRYVIMVSYIEHSIVFNISNNITI